jgi:hypothetical protein
MYYAKLPWTFFCGVYKGGSQENVNTPCLVSCVDTYTSTATLLHHHQIRASLLACLHADLHACLHVCFLVGVLDCLNACLL